MTKTAGNLLTFLISGLILSSTLFVDKALAKKKRGKAAKGYNLYSSKNYIEGAYPFVIAADWSAVAQAFKEVGKKRKAKLAMTFAKRLEDLEKSESKK